MDTFIGGTGGSSAPSGGEPGGGSFVKDVTTASFMTEVIDASRTVPVIVDFWAPWCGPCKQLGPVLEKLVGELGGKVRLAKVNIDENQQLAQQLRIQSIPMVYAFFQGRPLDGFAGALPESQVKAFLDGVIAAAGGVPGTPAEADAKQLLDEAKAALVKGDHGSALGLFAQVLEADENNVEALAGLARCYAEAGETEAAENLIKDVPDDQRDHPDIQAVRSQLELSRQAAEGAAEIAPLQARVAADPGDLEARYDLAMAHFAAGAREAAVDELVEIVRRKRDWNDGAARKQLLKMFEAWGPTDPLTQEGRQRLSAVLFA